MISGSSSGKNYKQLGEEAWKKAEKINGDLFSLTYGVFVAHLLKTLPDVAAVNAQLDKMGFNIGCRLIDEFLAKNPGIRCGEWPECMEVASKVAFKQFLNVTVNVKYMEKEALLSMESDGLGGEWVELPETAIEGGLRYANILCGVIRGALEMVNLQVECAIVADPILNPSSTTTDIQVKFIKYIEEDLPPGE